jgi:nucleoside-diphosphate-sugar epimerase
MSEPVCNVFITGGTGSIGRYLIDELRGQSGLKLYLLIRNPSSSALANRLIGCDGIEIVDGRMELIAKHRRLLKEMDCLVHAAASWGGSRVFDINETGTLDLFAQTDPQRCRHIFYFSTASILDEDNRPDPAAWARGTPYLKSKYACLSRLGEVEAPGRIHTLFPTVVIGGGRGYPLSHAVKELKNAVRYLPLLRFVRLDGSFHFIHARDVARITARLLRRPAEEDRLVLGNAPLSLEECLREVCRAEGIRYRPALDITRPAQRILPLLFSRRMTAWDRFSLEKRHFLYKAVGALDFSLPGDLTTLRACLEELIETGSL